MHLCIFLGIKSIGTSRFSKVSVTHQWLGSFTFHYLASPAHSTCTQMASLAQVTGQGLSSTCSSVFMWLQWVLSPASGAALCTCEVSEIKIGTGNILQVFCKCCYWLEMKWCCFCSRSKYKWAEIFAWHVRCFLRAQRSEICLAFSWCLTTFQQWDSSDHTIFHGNWVSCIILWQSKIVPWQPF